VPQTPARARPVPHFDPAPQAPADVEEDDPYGVAPTSAREAGTKVARAPASPRPAPPVTALSTRPPPARVAAAPLPLSGGPAPLSLAAPVWSGQPIY
jgi:hypothetical protein